MALEVVQAVHGRQIAEHGGLDGIRDQGALESALARPQNLFAYTNPDAPALAAAYAYGLARNHAFADGNKRTAWIIARLFLADNGFSLRYAKPEAVKLMESTAAGTITETDLANWFRKRLV